MNLLLVGGTSEIGLAITRRLAPDRVVLLGRDQARLDQAAASLNGAQVDTGLIDASDQAGHPAAIESAFTRVGGFDVIVVAVGVLGAQAGVDADRSEAFEVMSVNFLGSGSLVIECLRQMRMRGDGTLVVLSSVAAERPRASNPVYGAAKAGLDALAQGLADATQADGPRVLVVRPGFVPTRMTEGLKPAPFATTPEAVAEATARAIKGNAHTIWVPGRLRFVFAMLRHLPRPLWRKLAL